MIESYSIYRLPRSHWHCQLSNFEWEGVFPLSLQDRVESFITQVLEGEDPHLILTGEPGCGKSHLGVAILRRILPEVGTRAATWVNVPEFCDTVKASFNQGTDPFEDYQDARRLVILDDLFGRVLTPYEIDHVLYRLIDTAYMNGAAVVVTMNPAVEEMQTYLKPHEVSRVLQGSTIIPMMSKQDRRRA
jgi:DNA replication protein DnaC